MRSNRRQNRRASNNLMDGDEVSTGGRGIEINAGGEKAVVAADRKKRGGGMSGTATDRRAYRNEGEMGCTKSKAVELEEGD